MTDQSLGVQVSSGDYVLVRDASVNLTFENISDIVTVYASQSVVGVTGGSNITIGAVNGTGVADLLTLWNSTNILVRGPVVGSGLVIAGAWIDNSTNVSVNGLA